MIYLLTEMNWSKSHLFCENKDDGNCKTEDRTSNCRCASLQIGWGLPSPSTCCCEANDRGNQAPSNRELDTTYENPVIKNTDESH